MSAFAQLIEVDHDGAFLEDETADHVGSPEREIEVTSQPRDTATSQIRVPSKVFVSR